MTAWRGISPVAVRRATVRAGSNPRGLHGRFPWAHGSADTVYLYSYLRRNHFLRRQGARLRRPCRPSSRLIGSTSKTRPTRGAAIDGRLSVSIVQQLGTLRDLSALSSALPKFHRRKSSIHAGYSSICDSGPGTILLLAPRLRDTSCRFATPYRGRHRWPGGAGSTVSLEGSGFPGSLSWPPPLRRLVIGNQPRMHRRMRQPHPQFALQPRVVQTS